MEKTSKILIACNAILLLGLIGIYVIHFTGFGTKSKVNADATEPLIKEGGLPATFIARISKLSEDTVRNLAKSLGIAVL